MARLLIADDDRDQLRLFQLLLRSAGHESLLAGNTAEAVEHLRNSAPDLVIMDLRFPNVAEGLALIRRIRELGNDKPIILLSGWPDEIYGTNEEKMVARVMTKPVAIRDLLDTVDELTRQSIT